MPSRSSNAGRFSKGMEMIGSAAPPKLLTEFSAAVDAARSRFEMVAAAEAMAVALKERGTPCTPTLLLEAAAARRGRRSWRALAAALDKAEEKLTGVLADLDQILGGGPLGSLMRDPAVDEILVAGPDRVFAKISGRTRITDAAFRNEREVFELCLQISSAAGRRLSAEHPIVDAVFPGGDTVAIVCAPISIDGTSLTIRRPGNRTAGGETAGTVPPRTPDAPFSASGDVDPSSGRLLPSAILKNRFADVEEMELA